MEDFAVGPSSTQIQGVNSAEFIYSGLDKAHSAFGTRQERVDVFSNPNNVTVNWNVGNGKDEVSGSGTYFTKNRLELGWARDSVVDLSVDSEIWVDLYSKTPTDVIASVWEVTLLDKKGRGATNTTPGGILSGQSLIGIRFRKSDYRTDQGFDWSNVTYLNWRQEWDNNPPQTFGTTKIFAVPELSPCVQILGAILATSTLSLFGRRRKKSLA